MKSLVESINESLNESVAAAAAFAALAACSAAFGMMSRHIQKVEGITYTDATGSRGIISWLLDKGEDMVAYFRNKGIEKAIKKIQDSDEYKEWLDLPKKQRTLKRLEEIAKKVAGDDVHFAAISSIWTDYKKEQQ